MFSRRSAMGWAIAVFLTGIVLAFVSSALWGTLPAGAAFLLLGLVAATMIVVANSDDNKPPGSDCCL